MQQLIKRKDNIVYVREIKEPNYYNTNMHIRINKDELNAFKAKAKANNVNYSDIVRNAVREYIKEGE